MFTVPNNAAACSCEKPIKLKAELGNSSTVFLGRIEEQFEYFLTPKLSYIQAEVSVVEKYKFPKSLKTSTKRIIIYTPKEESRCGIPFESGKEYIIFAHGNNDFLQTTSCSRTIVREDAEKLEKYLIRWKKHRKLR